MSLNSFIEHLQNHPEINLSAQKLSHDQTKIHWTGIFGSAKSVFASGVAQQCPGHHVFVLNDKEEAAYFLNDLQGLYPEDPRLVFYPASYKVPYQIEEVDNANVVARTEALKKLSVQENCWIITYPDALFEKVLTKKKLVSNTMKIEVGKTYSLDFINELLLEYHFERVNYVYEPGQFSIRGGIVDVFSYGNDTPFRIEFFGNEVESIRTFDAADQLSINTHKFFSIVPNIQGKMILDGMDSFFQYLNGEITIWIDSIERAKASLKKEFDKANKIYESLDQEIKKTLPSDLFINDKDFTLNLENYKVVEMGTQSYFKGATAINFELLPQPSFNKNFNLLIDDLGENQKNNFQNYIFSNQPKQIERLYQIFEDIGGDVAFTPISTALHEGFICKTLKIICYTDHQLFERYHRFRLKEGFRKAKQALTLKEIYNLQKGDYVTHIDHGVGQFSGLETIDVNNKKQEAIRLIYKDGDVLYVGIHSLHRISKFTGKEGSVPKMNKLGTQSWNTLKTKTKKKIKELAFDLIKLYAKRKNQPGYSFAEDTYLQNELEASFIFEDTPDQFKATQDVKKDMESKTPMDRLICGDVGFGKTEVAIRAAFKAVADSKQVAVLVPTTILSLQHYRSFKERLSEFPCNIDYINRFKSAKETTKTIEKLKSGKIDILIGTHAIVSDRIKFKDLGLMIIDEEQKFGVAVKDKLKTMRTSVDTLTLTATPIPRTLQFSLMGARDLSIINTPPPNRQPVLTEIISLNEETIRDAISYEVSRGGQVFFVNNRIANIQEIAGMIQRLCPGVRVGIGHGQMDGKVLEQNMLNFIKGAYDVLIATTIIESGIDISNANTIIINNANNFGLSDLHQLRGRVGRSNKKAFCYLIAPKFSLLSSEARKRLEALVQFTDLGSGFNIAMKDLDIRGAGNMLGGEQSGFISEIGFEMYQKILNEAMKELRDDEFKDLFNERTTDQMGSYSEDCIFETDYEVRIPDYYVNDVTERLSLYQELDHIESMEKLLEFEARMKDRFGTIPKEVKELFFSFELRWLAQKLGLERLVIKSEKMVGWFIADPKSSFYQTDVFSELLKKIMNMGQGYRLIQKQDKLRLVVEPISNIREAYQKLNALYEEKEAIESTDT
ncbi:transcription-repair coupling factor [Crocinitomicaceae bacterium]|jgi:transcription-repair coupling factor (superfamily II helicase)|nr:transcription-repair coupling factor [Crocinitomicaceae bacterium]MDC0297062.1 transcription-repair coupling factor [Crocinitomicaceae bacterium]